MTSLHRVACAIALMLVGWRGLFCQVNPGKRPSFDVTSVKPEAPGNSHFQIRDQPGGRFVLSGVSLKMLMMFAYRVQEYQIIGGPNWISSDHWSIEAKTDDPEILTRTTTNYMLVPDPVSLRVQSLIEQEFQLREHREYRERPMYELELNRGDLRPALSDDQTPVVLREEWQPSIMALQLAVGGLPPPPPPMPGQTAFSPVRGQITMWRDTKALMHFEGKALPLANLVVTLAQQLGRPIADNTRLAGLYDIRLQWSPEPTTTSSSNETDSDSAPMVAAEPSGPSLFIALEQQLGLKLISRKASVEAMVIDSIQKLQQR